MKTTLKNICAIMVLFGFASFAQADVKQDVEDLVSDIQSELRRGGQDRNSLREARRHLERAYGALRGQSGPGGGGLSSLTCIARDNDGRQPWMIGVRTGLSVNATKIQGTNLGSKDDCLASVNSAVRAGRADMMCGTRDNDGRSPYSLVIYQEGQSVLSYTVSSDLNECLSTLRGAKSVRGGAFFCISRDNDGRSPWVQAVYNSRDHKVETGRDTYSTMQECVNSL